MMVLDTRILTYTHEILSQFFHVNIGNIGKT